MKSDVVPRCHTALRQVVKFACPTSLPSLNYHLQSPHLCTLCPPLTAAMLQLYQIYMNWMDKLTHNVIDILPKTFATPELEHERIRVVLAFSVMHTTVFFGCSLVFAMLDHFNLFQRYRIQPRAYAPKSLILKALGHTLFNHFVLNPILLYFVWPSLHRNNVFSSSLKNMPSPQTTLWHLLGCIAFEDTTFYWLHRALHTKYLYAAIHKQHHQFKQNVGVAAEYASPLEEIFGTAVPFLMASVLMKVHLSTFLLWTALRISETVNSHSGYYLPWIPYNWFPSFLGGSDRHDFHHSNNKGSFGSWTRFWDWACGTDGWYWQNRAKKSKD